MNQKKRLTKHPVLGAVLILGVLIVGSCSDLFGPADNPKDPLNADKRTYTVTYDGNAQTGGSVPVDSATYLKGAIVTTLPNSGSLAKTGHSFGGWASSADGSETVYAPGSTFAIVAANVTLYARWVPSAADLTVTAGNASNTLTWSALAGATSYNIYWSTTTGVTPSNGNLIAGVTSPFNHTPLTNGTPYYYVLTSLFGTVESAPSGQQNATPAAPISVLALPGVVVPVLGAAPVTTPIDTTQYAGTISWSPTVATFAGSIVYTATITLSAKIGFTLTGVAANSFTVAGATSVTNAANSGTVTAVFPATAAATVNALAIPGVVVPVAGIAPVTTSIDATQYTGAISWSPTATSFAAGTVYTATITLTAKSGRTLNGVAANSFAVAGATATNAANSGVVTAVFPMTELDLVQVPAGKFRRDAGPTNDSEVSAFKIGRYEITRAQFLSVMGTDPSSTTYSSGTSDPVQRVNWYQAIAFCNKLSIQEGLPQAYSVSGVTFSSLTFASIPTTSNATWNAATVNGSATGYRLPTEAEWEWAAMDAPTDGQGGGTNTTGYLKAFAGSTGSNLIGDYAVYDYHGSGAGKTTTARSNAVGSRLANELGLFDMSGNVWEWVYDWRATYDTGPLTNPTGAASGSYRVVRGGSWDSTAPLCTVAFRYNDYPNDQNYSCGFRVVRP